LYYSIIILRTQNAYWQSIRLYACRYKKKYSRPVVGPIPKQYCQFCKVWIVQKIKCGKVTKKKC